MKEIAMRCTQEQFDDIFPILKANGFSRTLSNNFDQYPYLVNYYRGNVEQIRNFKNVSLSREIFEEWDKKTFLKSCGITDYIPNKWCVKRDIHTFKEINEYVNKINNVTTTDQKPNEDNCDYLYSEIFQNSWFSKGFNNHSLDFEEISFETFLAKIYPKVLPKNSYSYTYLINVFKNYKLI